MRHFSIFLFLLAGITTDLEAQMNYNTAYGVKGGVCLGFQNWNGQTRTALFVPLANGTFFIEAPLDSLSSFIVEAGYHTRGSSIFQNRFTYLFDGRNIDVPATTYNSVFQCAGIQGAFKKNYILQNGVNAYWLFGVRLEYVFKDSIAFHSELPIRKENISKFLYGVTIGGGIEKRYPNSPIILQLELQGQPDVARQIEQPAAAYFNRFTQTNEVFGEQRVINFTTELTLGIKYALFDDPDE